MPAIASHSEIQGRAVAQKQAKKVGGGSAQARGGDGAATSSGVDAPADFQETLQAVMKPKAEPQVRPKEAERPQKGAGKGVEKKSEKKQTTNEDGGSDEVEEQPAEPTAQSDGQEPVAETEKDTDAKEGQDKPESDPAPTPAKSIDLAVMATVVAPAQASKVEQPRTGQKAPQAGDEQQDEKPAAVASNEPARKPKDAGVATVRPKGKEASKEQEGEAEEPHENAKQTPLAKIEPPVEGPPEVKKDAEKTPEMAKAKGAGVTVGENKAETKPAEKTAVTLPASAQDAFAKVFADASKAADVASSLPQETKEPAEKPAVAQAPVTPMFGQDGPKQTTPNRAEAASAAQDQPVHDSQETFDQVVLGLRTKMDAKNGKAEIELNPPNLGKVNVSVTLENGTLTAQFQSSSDQVRGLLKDNLEKLKTVLEGQGVTVDKLAVNAPESNASPRGNAQGQAFGDAARDGRSGNQYQRDARSGNRRPEAGGFASVFRGKSAASTPIDLVG